MSGRFVWRNSRGKGIQSNRLALGSILSILVLGCAYVPLAPLGAGRSIEALDRDEQHLWKQSRELQHEIETSGLLFQDDPLDAYLRRVLERVTATELVAAAIRPRVRVISDVNFHGYSFANGVIYIHTALLSRMQDESQLATLLSRELAHVIHRHALRTQRDRRVQADTLAWVGIGASFVQGGGTYKLLVKAASISSVAGFHHYLETAADQKGLATLAAAGYPVAGTPGFFQMTIAYLKEVHSQGPWGWAAFIPPPGVTARIGGYERLIASEYGDRQMTRSPIADPVAFRRLMHPATIRQAELELAAGLFVSAEASARLAISSNSRDVEAWMMLGRALEGQRSNAIAGRALPLISDVREAFGGALKISRRYPAAIREMGMTFYRGRHEVAHEKDVGVRTPEETSEALRHFRRYLRLAPNAGDVEYIQGYIRELEGGSP